MASPLGLKKGFLLMHMESLVMCHLGERPVETSRSLDPQVRAERTWASVLLVNYHWPLAFRSGGLA